MKLILGLGVTGLSVARFFSLHKITYRIADSRLNPPMLDLSRHENLIIDCHLGAWQESTLNNISEIIISPGIAITEEIVKWALNRKISIISDIELFGRYVKAPVIGITGSNGKSTVTQLLGEMALADGVNAVICGNIGEPVMASICEDAELYVVELSSYQLDYTHNLELFAGVINNISPDHLDRYSSYDDYIKSKLSIYSYCKFKVINLEETLVPISEGDSFYTAGNVDARCNFSAEKVGALYEVYYDGNSIINSDELTVVGRHNLENVLAALTLGYCFGLTINAMTQAAINFKGLEHRLEFVTKKNTIDYFNDSKSTNAISTKTAINALFKKYSNLTLILGGISKKEDYSELFQLINEKVSAVVLIGESSSDFSMKIKIPQEIAKSMKEAVMTAKTITKDGAVLLSPGCASFDMFVDFNDRGKAFKKHVFEEI